MCRFPCCTASCCTSQSLQPRQGLFLSFALCCLAVWQSKLSYTEGRQFSCLTHFTSCHWGWRAHRRESFGISNRIVTSLFAHLDYLGGEDEFLGEWRPVAIVTRQQSLEPTSYETSSLQDNFVHVLIITYGAPSFIFVINVKIYITLLKILLVHFTHM